MNTKIQNYEYFTCFVMGLIIVGFFINMCCFNDDDVLGIPTNNEQPAYVVTEVYLATNKRGGDDSGHVFIDRGIREDDCVYILKSVIDEDKGFDAFYNKIKLYRGCNNLNIGDTIFFAPITKNGN